MQEKILDLIEKHFNKKIALLLGWVLIGALHPFIKGVCEDINIGITYRYIFHGVLFAVWFFFWLYQRGKFPKNKKHYVGLVIAIKTESDKQKIRLKNDFIEELNSLIREKGLSDIINIILLNAYQAQKLQGVINDYSRSADVKAQKRWEITRKKIHGHLFIWGDIKERLDNGQNKYFWKIDALVIHRPIGLDTQKAFIGDMSKIWPKQISFEEAIEIKGFDLSANLIFMASRFIVGTAAFIYGDVPLALKLHESLRPEFSKFSPLSANLLEIQKRTLSFVNLEYLLLAKWYQGNRNIQDARNYLDKAMSIFPTYDGYMLKSIIDFYDNKPKDALDSVHKAKGFATIDGTWRYNEGFLLMYQEKFDEALLIYDKISETTYPKEDFTLNQVYDFNIQCVKSNPDKVQCYFILGYLKHKKASNYPEALDYFTRFLQNAENNIKYKPLIEAAKKYKAELEQDMGLTSL